MVDSRKCLGAGCGNNAGDLQCQRECFKRNWVLNGYTTVSPDISFPGTIRQVYTLSVMRILLRSIKCPHWAVAGKLKGERFLGRMKIDFLDAKGQEVIWKPGVTTDYLDEISHQAYIECDVRATLFKMFSFLTSAGDRAKVDPGSVMVVGITRECLDLAVETSNPARLYGIWGGHGFNTEFHPPPLIPHYGKNKEVEVFMAGMTFTIEPILALGSPRVICWPDDWTNVAADGKRTAQFDSVEVLTARNADSPGSPALLPTTSEATEANRRLDTPKA
ncbi:hypothetical protein BDV09DRAFT_205748 [Aspergillus tetrazonus]